jgi:glutamate N-acetyltransferase/amino-acid N-acetyltransferase
MLSSVFTDAKISKELLNVAVKYAASRSFNAISIDGDTSTNDTFAVLSNGAALMEEITDANSKEFKEFRENLTDFATGLAQLIVRDGEGATKFVQVKVTVKVFLSRVLRLLTTPNKSQTQL